MNVELENSSFCILGLPGSGKSTLANLILTTFGASAFVYDTLHEFPDEPYDSYSPRKAGDVAEYESVVRAVFNNRRYNCLVTDEANRYCPSKPTPLPQAIADINDWRKHVPGGFATGYICRLPVQLNQDLTQMADWLFIFRIPGKQTTQYLNDISQGLGETVLALPQYHFVVVDINRRYRVHKPIPASFATKKTAHPPKL